MEPTNLDHVLARIGSAVARVERAIDHALLSATVMPVAPITDPAADNGLAARHEALRQSVSATLGEIDALIGSLER